MFSVRAQFRCAHQCIRCASILHRGKEVNTCARPRFGVSIKPSRGLWENRNWEKRNGREIVEMPISKKREKNLEKRDLSDVSLYKMTLA